MVAEIRLPDSATSHAKPGIGGDTLHGVDFNLK